MLDHKQRSGVLTSDDINDEVVRNDSAYMFDAIWTAALALNRTATRLNETTNVTLLDFDYDDKYNISDIVYEEALKTEFFGLTVSVNAIASYVNHSTVYTHVAIIKLHCTCTYVHSYLVKLPLY